MLLTSGTGAYSTRVDSNKRDSRTGHSPLERTTNTPLTARRLQPATNRLTPPTHLHSSNRALPAPRAHTANNHNHNQQLRYWWRGPETNALRQRPGTKSESETLSFTTNHCHKLASSVSWMPVLHHSMHEKWKLLLRARVWATLQVRVRIGATGDTSAAKNVSTLSGTD